MQKARLPQHLKHYTPLLIGREPPTPINKKKSDHHPV